MRKKHLPRVYENNHDQASVIFNRNFSSVDFIRVIVDVIL